MIKLIIGTPENCMNWVAGTYNDADFSPAWNYELILTEIESGSVTGDMESDQAILLVDQLCPVLPSKNWQLWIIDATQNIGGDWTIDEIFFGGTITSTPKTVQGKSADGIVNFYNIKASSFEKEVSRLYCKQSTRVNQWTDNAMKAIIAESTDSTVVRVGTLSRPAERLSVVRFNNERTALSALRALADMDDETHELIIQPVLSSFAGAEISFREIQKQYAPVILDEDFRLQPGPENVIIEPSNLEQRNIVTLPYYEETWREPERFLQLTTTEEAELNSRVPLTGIPASIETCIIYQDYFGGDVKSDLILENDKSNPFPPEGHLSSEGYLLQGEINFVQGMHFLEASSENPDWGEIARVSDPDEIVFEPVLNTQLRIKEITVSTRGDAILCAYYDLDTYETTITNVVSTSVFDVDNEALFSADMLATINNEHKVIDSLVADRITLKDALSALPEVGDTVSVSIYNKSRIILGLETKADGTLYLVENGTSTLISGYTYNEETIYTIRNHCNIHETWLTADTSTAELIVKDLGDVAANDILELHNLGNDLDPIDVKVSSVNAGLSKIVLTEAQGDLTANTRLRTKAKATLQINGGGTPVDAASGKYNEASGKNWTTLGSMTNTFQSVIDQPREIGFAIILQKTLEGTIKEFKCSNYPPIELTINGAKKVISTPDDSAEKDIDAFINARNDRYFLELPSDTKTAWASDTILEVKYKEKRLKEIVKYDMESIEAVAIERGCPILETDSFAVRLKKGGVPASKEELLPNPMTFLEAATLAEKIKEERSRPKFQVTIKNLFNLKYGEFKVGQQLRIELDEFTGEMPIEKVVKRFIPAAGTLKWMYEISANVTDRVAALMKKAGNTSRKILDEATDDTVVLDAVYGFQEKLTLSDAVSTDIADYTDNIFTVTIGGAEPIPGEDYEDVTLETSYLSSYPVRNIFDDGDELYCTGSILGGGVLYKYDIDADTFNNVMTTGDNPDRIIYDVDTWNGYFYLAHNTINGNERYSPVGGTSDNIDYGIGDGTQSLSTYNTEYLAGGKAGGGAAYITKSTSGNSGTFSKFWAIRDYYSIGHNKYSSYYVPSMKQFGNNLFWGTSKGQLWKDTLGTKALAYEFDSSADDRWVRPLLAWKDVLYASDSYLMVATNNGLTFQSVTPPADCAYIVKFAKSLDEETFIIVGKDSNGHAAAWSTYDFITWTKFYTNASYTYFYSFYDDGINLWFGTNEGIIKTSVTRVARSSQQAGERVETYTDIRHLVTYKAA